MQLKLALGVKGAVTGHRLGALEGGGTSPLSNASLVAGGGGGGQGQEDSEQVWGVITSGPNGVHRLVRSHVVHVG